MDKNELLERFNRCKEKADMYFPTITIDPDEIADIEIDEDNTIVVDDIRTPFTCDDVEKVKFCKYEDEENFVRIKMKSGEYLDFEEDCEISACLYKTGKLYTYSGPTRYSSLKRLEEMEEERKLGVNREEFVVVRGELRAYNGSASVIVIPEGVQEIMPGVFENYDVVSVEFPTSMKIIGKSAFKSCESLESINLNEGLEIIGDRAFCGCKKLRTIRLPYTLLAIEPFAFGYSGIESVEGMKTDINIDNGNLHPFEHTPVMERGEL